MLSALLLGYASCNAQLPSLLLALSSSLAMAVFGYRQALRLRGLVLLFDGKGWFSSRGEPVTVLSVYAGRGLLATSVEVAGQRHRLLLCSTDCSRECWRRLWLGLAGR